MLPSIADRPRRASARRPFVVLAACAAVVAVAPASASAAGNVGLTVGGNGKAAKALSAADVKVAAIAPAKKRGKRVTLPVQSVTVAKGATVALRGGIRFKAGKRAVALKSVKVTLTSKKATVSAKAGKSRLPVFVAAVAKGKAKLDRTATTAKLAGTKLTLTAKGAKLLRKKLAADSLAAGPLGQIAVDASSKGSTGPGPGPGGGTPGGGTGGGGGTPAICSTSGPESGPLPPEPPVAAQQAGAVAVTSATLVWRPRESWIRYIAGGDGTSVSGGAANGPLETKSGSTLVYSFVNFPLKSGWRNPDGSAVLNFAGGVGFRWTSGPNPHCINFTASDPEIEITPAGGSRAIFRFDGTDGTPFPNRRGVLVELTPGSDQDATPAGYAYPDMVGKIPAGAGSSVFAGFYPGGTEFGTISVTFNTP
jgi:hypothetical protein